MPGTGQTIRGFARLGFDAVEQITNIVEGMYRNIAAQPWPWGEVTAGRAPGVAGLVHECIRLINGSVREGVDLGLGSLSERLDAVAPPGRQREAVVAALNGVIGDHLEETGNPLAIAMCFRRNGEPIEPTAESIAAAFPGAGRRLLVVVHGLCMNDHQWTRRGHSHAEALAEEFGYTPAYLHYNSGKHISENGREFAALLESLTAHWPVEIDELSVLAHSMGGLITRSAHYYALEAGYGWPDKLNKIVFLGTPHHGAPLERRGDELQGAVALSPYTAPLSRLGALRSAGVTDLRHGSLLDQDWRDRDRFGDPEDRRKPLPLPEGVDCYAAAATLGKRKKDFKDQLLADGLVPVPSALGKHHDPGKDLNFPAERQWIGYELNHWDLLDSPKLYEQLKTWLAAAASG